MLKQLPNTTPMFGASYLPGESLGGPLEDRGYSETEFLFSGEADRYGHDQEFGAVVEARAVPFVTRVVVRMPQRPEEFSGTVHFEPLHPDLDGAISWRMLQPHLIASGHAHVGVGVFPAALAMLGERVDPARYGSLRIEDDGHALEIVGRLLVELCGSAEARAKLLNGRHPERIYLSGWSATGSFCRVFLNEGFHARARRPDGTHCLSGALIAISSGARSFGYQPLTARSPQVPVGHPRRILQPAGVPVIEYLTEYEVETSASTERPDADEPQDRFRRYHVAGTSHSTEAPSDSARVAARQLELAGVPQAVCEILEQPAQVAFDSVTRAVVQRLERWAEAGQVPPRVAPFTRLDDPQDGPHGLAEGARPLLRDADGNVVGGIRTPWVDVPSAVYLPHSTPMPGRCQPSPFAPTSDPATLADLRGHRRPFSPEKMLSLYGDARTYERRVAERVRDLTRAGWLLPQDAADLTRELGAQWPGNSRETRASVPPSELQREVGDTRANR